MLELCLELRCGLGTRLSSEFWRGFLSCRPQAAIMTVALITKPREFSSTYAIKYRVLNICFLIIKSNANSHHGEHIESVLVARGVVVN
jgi:hypothetical protein